MLTLCVYSADGEFILKCQMDDMASFLYVIRTEFEPRWAAQPEMASISGKMLVVDSVRGPDSMVPALSQRQREIIDLLARSYSPKQIAFTLDVSESTVRMHIEKLKKRFNVSSCYHLMAVATALGLCDPFIEEPRQNSIIVSTDDDPGLKKPLPKPRPSDD
ncbi:MULTISPECIES: helix-turn-helix transcriptional regulator [Gordonibacter]|uniref:Helix-turn-helix transcriptional regulator n=1 Tax=Gordonibacter faecis TaxID=3047475 RepID=A0ABT7DRU8_9ACTN|nr:MULTISPECIES: helix-turn-helix transcriptional regulator [unclassified Gordonibacter]MDJ1650900.1 helix-turn-helix transcriptional regulator [Gordonibacter sp. KGMB12511]HIW77439.1 helix-turn-helix transcriptional regulator [Candidatus Gordonibacter avicola]